ncbi:MAG TPA: hypothetical protein VHE13_12685 [Opitutus sp.]|nr:hypothetical protein [Opitutus sp.]
MIFRNGAGSRRGFSGASGRAWFWTGAAAVLLFQLHHLYGLHVSKDLPLWDESAYLGWGDKFLATWKVGSITNSPFYHVLYGAVIAVTGLMRAFFAMQYLLKLTLTALLFGLVYRFSRSVALSVLLGVIFAYSYYHLDIDVGVYYGAMIPYFAAILVARRWPGLSLGLSFLAGLGRLEYMAVPAVHLVFLVAMRVCDGGKTEMRGEDGGRKGRPTVLGAVPAVAVWVLNGFVLTRVTVWQFHNRVWFAWSQNYAFFRYQTGRDSGGNPWLDHQFIAERDFPHAHSLAQAFAVNPTAALQHTWFNLSELPGYLGAFAIAHENSGAWRYAPLYALAAVVGAMAIAVVMAWPGKAAVRRGLKARGLEIALCAGGIVAAAPSVIVSTKTNYIMSIVPATLLVVAGLHVLARRSGWYARWSGPALLAIAAAYAAFSFCWPAAYSTKRKHGPVYRDAMTMRAVLEPYRGLRLLGTSTASYINYLGWKNGDTFIEPLAISPINQQATDMSLAGLIRAHDPDVLLINSTWRSSKTYAEALKGFDFADWIPHRLVDGVLYTKRGLPIGVEFDGGWFDAEQGRGRTWRWSRGDAGIDLRNGFAGRHVTLDFWLKTTMAREVTITLGGEELFAGALEPGVRKHARLPVDSLPLGVTKLEFRTAQPPVPAPGNDPRKLAFAVEEFAVVCGPPARPR